MSSLIKTCLPKDEEIISSIEDDGFFVVEGLLPLELVDQLQVELEKAILLEAEWHGNTSYSDYGMVLVCAKYGRIFIDLLANKDLMRTFDICLGSQSKVYAYTSSSMPPLGSNFSNRIHRDCPRVIPNYITNMGCTIALSEFTELNGASYFLRGSHKLSTPPSPDEFFIKSDRFVAPRGSVIFFNALTYHAGGINTTDNWRHALTLNMCRSWMQQRLDLPRMLGSLQEYHEKIPDEALQKLGYFCQPPSSLEEYYAPEHVRPYRQVNE